MLHSTFQNKIHPIFVFRQGFSLSSMKKNCLTNAKVETYRSLLLNVKFHCEFILEYISFHRKPTNVLYLEVSSTFPFSRKGRWTEQDFNSEIHNNFNIAHLIKCNTWIHI